MSDTKSRDVKRRAYKFSLQIINLVKTFPRKSIYWVISSQLLGAATSIGANLIEAKAACSKREFIHFLQIALKSANETIYWLNLLRDSDLVSVVTINPIIMEAKEIAAMVASSVITAKKNSFNKKI